MAVMGLHLFGVVPHDGAAAAGGDLVRIPFRDLAAVLRRTPFRVLAPAGDAVLDHFRVVDRLSHRMAVLPAPFGTIFRTPDDVTRWLEINYIALAEGVHFVEGRCEVRLHITERSHSDGEPPAVDVDIAAASADIFRALRRQATAAIPLRERAEAPVRVSSAFLLERARLLEFETIVAEQARQWASLDFELTGPWPPYDFVRMDVAR